MSLGLTLSKCRNPDILLQVNKEHGSLKASQAALKLIQWSPEEIGNVPLECLCHLMLMAAQQRGIVHIDDSSRPISEELQSLV